MTQNDASLGPLRVAVVGAGIAGLSCAGRLRARPIAVTVFDRGRAPGGRLSTRRTTGDDGRVRAFDHGAPFFTVHDEQFGGFVRTWIDAGVCTHWSARCATWDGHALAESTPPSALIVGTPGMSAVCRHLARDLDVRSRTSVTELASTGDGWRLKAKLESGEISDEGPFDAVVLAMPAPQAARLLEGRSETLVAALAGMRMQPTWVGMLGVDDPLTDVPDVIEVTGDPVLAQLVRDDAKPGRSASDTTSQWLAHAGTRWSAARYDAAREDVGDELRRAALRVLTDMAGRVVSGGYAAAHRWGLARPAETHAERCVLDDGARLVVCGESFGGSGVEAAFLSGFAAADAVVSLRANARAASQPIAEPPTDGTP